MLQPSTIGINVPKKRSYHDYSKTLLATHRFYNWLNAMKISSSRFLKEPGRKTHHKKPFKDNRRTVVALLSLLIIAVTSMTNTITTPLSLFNQEARASQEQQQQEGTAGLKVYVDLYHNRIGSVQLCVLSTYEDLGCNTINLSQYPSSPIRSGPWTFSPRNG
jgi:hypothetical protein